MWDTKLGMMLETFLLNTGAPRHSPPPPPIPTSPRVHAIEHQRLTASPTASACLSRVGTAIPPVLRSKDTAKPTSPEPSPLLEPEIETEFPPPRLAPLVRSTSWAAPGGGGPRPSTARPPHATAEELAALSIPLQCWLCQWHTKKRGINALKWHSGQFHRRHIARSTSCSHPRTGHG